MAEQTSAYRRIEGSSSASASMLVISFSTKTNFRRQRQYRRAAAEHCRSRRHLPVGGRLSGNPGKFEIACDDLGPQLLKNIAEPVRAWRVRFGAQGVAGPASAPVLPDRPSIAALPFENMSGDPEQGVFCRRSGGGYHDRAGALQSLFVIARIPRSPTKVGLSTSGRSDANWACAMCWKAVCERPARRCGSPGS